MLPASAKPIIVGVLSFVVVAEVVNDDGALGGVISLNSKILIFPEFSPFSSLPIEPTAIFVPSEERLIDVPAKSPENSPEIAFPNCDQVLLLY